MLPISDIPLSLREFASQFRSVFRHPAQREKFEILLAGLIASENKTLAGIHQKLVGDTGYRALHHFMTDSPWDHAELRQKRLEFVAKQVAEHPAGPRVVALDSTLVLRFQINGNQIDFHGASFCKLFPSEVVKREPENHAKLSITAGAEPSPRQARRNQQKPSQTSVLRTDAG